MSEKMLRPAPPELPATKSDLSALLRYKQRKTIIDYVMEINETLWEDPEYQKYLEAIFDEQAVTGSVDTDHFVAAQMIKAKAREMGMVQLQNEKEWAIVKALRRVLGRYEKMSLQERREIAMGTGTNTNEKEQEG
jgi:hypothetical protein